MPLHFGVTGFCLCRVMYNTSRIYTIKVPTAIMLGEACYLVETWQVQSVTQPGMELQF